MICTFNCCSRYCCLSLKAWKANAASFQHFLFWNAGVSWSYEGGRQQFLILCIIWAILANYCLYYHWCGVDILILCQRRFCWSFWCKIFVNCGFFWIIQKRPPDKATVVDFQLKTYNHAAEGLRVSVGFFTATLVNILSRKAKTAANSKGTASSQFCSQVGGNDFTGFSDHVWHWTKPWTKHQQRLDDKKVRETTLLPTNLFWKSCLNRWKHSCRLSHVWNARR